LKLQEHLVSGENSAIFTGPEESSMKRISDIPAVLFHVFFIMPPGGGGEGYLRKF